MLQMESVVLVGDNSGAKKVKCYHVVGSTGKRFAYVGDICNASVVQALPNGKLKKGDKVRVLVVATKKELKRPDGSFIKADNNYVVLFEENPTRVLCPVFREIRVKFAKLASMALEVL